MDEFVNKDYKTKNYVRRAMNKYRKKKYNEDEDYKNKTLECSKNNYNKNKDNEEYKMKRKLYMREYRAKKKAEKLLSAKQQSENESASNDIVSNTLEK
jgi:hypothetical protein